MDEFDHKVVIILPELSADKFEKIRQLNHYLSTQFLNGEFRKNNLFAMDVNWYTLLTAIEYCFEFEEDAVKFKLSVK